MRRKIHWGFLLLSTSLFGLVGTACGGDPPSEGQAHYRTYRPSADQIPPEHADDNICYQAYAGIGAEVPLRPGAGIGVPELPTGVEGTFPKDPGGPVQDGQPRQDGNGIYQVSCTVAGSGDGPYRISAELSGANGSPFRGSPSKTSITITGGVIETDGKGYGQVTSYSFESKGVAPLPGKTCALEAVPNPATGKRIIGPGSAFLVFKCAGVTSDGAGSYCHSEGTVILGNCARE